MGTEMKHTPGPWSFEINEGGTVICKDGASIGSAFGSKVISGEALPHEANARLIAAAPEMLEALRDIAKQWPDSSAAKTARSAIAKATTS